MRTKFSELHIEAVPLGPKLLEVFFRQAKQTNGGRQPPAMFGMSRMLELLLQMNESTCRLNQALEILRVVGLRLQPDLLENVVRLIVTLLIPALEECAIIRDCLRSSRGSVAGRLPALADKLGNPLAFAYEGPNLGAPAMMGKRARFSFREGERLHDRGRSEK